MSEPRYVDHPAPSPVMIGLVLLLLVVSIRFIADVPRHDSDLIPWLLTLSVPAILLFYCWPFYTTYYTLDADGLEVRYGPWKKRYAWSEFSAAYWQKGMFATRIGWPSITPCVRLTDAVHLRRNDKRFGLYLTPNDSRAFLGKITELAPDLTRQTIC